MKQILVVGGISTDPADVQEIEDFAAGVRQSAGAEAEVYYAQLDQLSFVFAPGDFRIFDTRQGRAVQSYDLVILRSKMRKYGALAYCISKFCTDRGVAYFNDYGHYYNGTKIIQAVLFYEQQVPFLKTVYALGHDVLLEAMQRELSFPCIIKDAHGAHGNSNYLVHTVAEARQVFARQPEVMFIAQEFCPNDRDYRILVLDDECLVLERRGGKETHLNNTSQGAEAVLAPHAVPPAVLAQARQLARAMRLRMAGVDSMPHSDTGAFYFLEVNSQPQIFTGALLPEKAAHFSKFLQRQLGGS